MEDIQDYQDQTRSILCRFKTESGEEVGDMMDLPLSCTVDQLTAICNAILQNAEPVPYLFYANETEIKKSLEATLDVQTLNTESVLEIVYEQQAVFKVHPVTRCTASIPGHAEAVISVSFSPDGKHLASGSGDTTVRFWDVLTQTPYRTCKGHNNWVLCIAWSPDSRKLASACKDGHIIIWNPENGAQLGKTMKGHKRWVTSLSWEPYHSNSECRYLASSGKDGDVRIWDTILCTTIRTLAGHTKSVTVVKWGGAGLLYTASQDRTIKVWRAGDGTLCRTLEGHAHWVNALALSTDYVNRIGPFDPVHDDQPLTHPQVLERYERVAAATGGERLVSASDDFTLQLWAPETAKQALARLAGHRQVVNDVRFAPDGRTLASASFDKSIRLWAARTGAFLGALRGHVQPVFMVAFSADSRLLVSGSADSTLKVWDVHLRRLAHDLPGHGSDVYAVDWSTDGIRVASGGKDKVLKLWQN